MENSFEDKIKELETIVKELESGEVNLDDAIEKYTKAMNLAKECSDKLNTAVEKVNKVLKENGTLEEFNVENLSDILKYIDSSTKHPFLNNNFQLLFSIIYHILKSKSILYIYVNLS